MRRRVDGLRGRGCSVPRPQAGRYPAAPSIGRLELLDATLECAAADDGSVDAARSDDPVRSVCGRCARPRHVSAYTHVISRAIGQALHLPMPNVSVSIDRRRTKPLDSVAAERECATALIIGSRRQPHCQGPWHHAGLVRADGQSRRIRSQFGQPSRRLPGSCARARLSNPRRVAVQFI
jgi:hypothetical protein